MARCRCGREFDPGPKGYETAVCRRCDNEIHDKLEELSAKAGEELSHAYRTLHEMYALDPGGMKGTQVGLAKAECFNLLKRVRDKFAWADPGRAS
jgi:hypothetical protein